MTAAARHVVETGKTMDKTLTSWHLDMHHRDGKGAPRIQDLPYIDGLAMSSTEWRKHHPRSNDLVQLHPFSKDVIDLVHTLRQEVAHAHTDMNVLPGDGRTSTMLTFAYPGKDVQRDDAGEK